ncbi:hypothetical protein EDC04DRAFT_2943106 [Pisolithus marmoratus]|nr:hypothetical protein EDC04DRAFT_2943106 [Pisolithus marmoratus]
MEKQRMPPLKELTTPDTIPKPKQTSLAGYCSGDLALSRTAVLRDLGEIPSVSLDYFKSAALPPLLQQINIDKIKESLQSDPNVWSNASERCAGFDTELRDSKLSKDMMFNSPFEFSFKFKKGNGCKERKDDDKKVIWSLHHIMHSDPCRHATFGVTIENTMMRFWFTCRAVTLVSRSFNFFSEPEHLVYFFSSLAFANDHELGWDPTI